MALDRETRSSYWVTVFAQDLGAVPQSSSVDVYISVEDVNDNAPEATQPVFYFSVIENSGPDLPIATITVSTRYHFTYSQRLMSVIVLCKFVTGYSFEIAL